MNEAEYVFLLPVLKSNFDWRLELVPRMLILMQIVQVLDVNLGHGFMKHVYVLFLFLLNLFLFLLQSFVVILYFLGGELDCLPLGVQSLSLLIVLLEQL